MLSRPRRSTATYTQYDGPPGLVVQEDQDHPPGRNGKRKVIDLSSDASPIKSQKKQLSVKPSPSFHKRTSKADKTEIVVQAEAKKKKKAPKTRDIGVGPNTPETSITTIAGILEDVFVEDLECPLCRKPPNVSLIVVNIFISPMSTSCGHVFCDDCSFPTPK